MHFSVSNRYFGCLKLLNFGLKTLVIALVLVLSIMPHYANAQNSVPVEGNETVSIPDAPNPHRFVNDYADILTPEQEQTLENKLVDIDQSTTVQIAVVTIKTSGNVPLTDYAQQLFQKWGIGQKGKDNGLLLTVAISDRKSEITVGYGLEGEVTDFASKHILDNVLRPYFREEKYFEGITASTDSLIQLSQGKYIFETKSIDNIPKKESFSYFNVIKYSLLGILIYLILGFISCAFLSVIIRFLNYLKAHLKGGAYLENYKKEQLELKLSKSKSEKDNLEIRKISTWGSFYGTSGSFSRGDSSSSEGSSGGGGGISGSW